VLQLVLSTKKVKHIVDGEDHAEEQLETYDRDRRGSSMVFSVRLYNEDEIRDDG